LTIAAALAALWPRLFQTLRYSSVTVSDSRLSAVDYHKAQM